MFKAAFHKPILAIVGAAVVVTMVSTGASFAGEGGGDGGMGAGNFGQAKGKISTISSTNPDGSTTSIRSRNGAKTYTITRFNKKGKVVSRQTKAKKSRAFVTIHNPDGTTRTVSGADR